MDKAEWGLPNMWNTNSMYSLSFDVDWAPDYVIEDVLKLLTQYNIPSTWFITHPSQIWEKLKHQNEMFDLGIHPNFLHNSTQGKSVEEITRYLMNIVPKSKVFRTHGFFQYGALLAEIQKTTKINIDSSIFLPEIDYIQPVSHLTPYGILKRIPVYWADDYELLKTEISNNFIKKIGTYGIKVFNFHPIHIYLNSPSFDFYENSKNNSNLNELSPYPGFGMRILFIELLNFLSTKKKQINFIKDY